MKRSLVLSLALALAASLLGPAVAPAGQDVWTNTTIAPGVIWKHRIYSSLHGGKQTVNVIEVDLSRPDVTVRPLGPATGCKKTSTMAINAGAVAAVNGGYFSGTCGSTSMFKVNGSVTATNPSNISGGRSTFGLATATDTPLIKRVASTDSWAAANHAIGGGPNLVTNSAAAVNLAQEGWSATGTHNNRHPRTAVGYVGQKLLMVTVDGRTTAGIGMTCDQLAAYMISLGCTHAVNLDGGGSTASWAQGQGILNTPSDGTERSVVTALGVFYTPTAVTVDNSSSNFTASANWWSGASTPGFIGTDYMVRSTEAISDAATWAANLATAGTYKVEARFTSGTNRASSASYIVYHTGGSTTKVVNQQINGGTWVDLGNFSMASGTATRVALSCWTTSGTYVVADAIRLTKQ